jgi:hypothetical protein
VLRWANHPAAAERIVAAKMMNQYLATMRR